MQTVIAQIKADIEELQSLMEEFFLNHSKIIYYPLNTGDSGVFILGSDYCWGELGLEGKQIQVRLYNAYQKFTDLTEVLISDLPGQPKDAFEANTKSIFHYIEQNSMVWESNTQDVLNKAIDHMNSQMDILSTLYDSRSDSFIFVPDTNALLTNPQIENWVFDGISNFEILIIPTVAAEIDKLKMYHSNREVREKAISIIKRFKEYRRRGTITEGIKIVNNKISFRALAVEPDFENTLSWLDPQNNDDRIIASFIEVMKTHPRSVVVLVTSDFNLQNKAEFVRLNFVETPGMEGE